ncbi:MAG TPA: hypothetical protein VGK74_14885 [Symbiobacteriaceae bacterium]|jgi:BASS family bile acid:Na+ symporter
MRILTDYVLYWILLAGVCGYLLPGPATAGEFLVPWLLFAMMLGLGLTMAPGDFRGALRRREALGALALQLIAIPLTAAALRFAVRPTPLRDGIFVLGLAPAEITSALMAGLAGGDLPLSATLLVLSMATSLLVIPLAAGTQAAGPLAVELLLCVLLPLGLGMLVRANFWQPRRELCDATSASAVIGLVFIACGPVGGAGLPALLTLVLVALAMVAAGFGWGVLAGRLVGASGGRLVSMVFFGGMREFGVAAAVALAAFPSGAALPAAIYGPVMMVVAGVVASRLRVRHSVRGKHGMLNEKGL